MVFELRITSEIFLRNISLDLIVLFRVNLFFKSFLRLSYTYKIIVNHKTIDNPTGKNSVRKVEFIIFIPFSFY